jgi:hypothetical protein
MSEQILLYVCIGGAVSLLGFFVSRVAIGSEDDKLRERLAFGDRPGASPSSSAGSASDAVVPILQKIGTAAAQPFMPKTREKQSSLRRDLGYAGIYSPSAVRLVTGAKFICLIFGLIAGYIAGLLFDNLLLFVSLGGLVGYFVPRIWLKTRIKTNQKALTLGLPDALDLMVVCVEAGLTIDSAMQRVGQELGLAHPDLSRELGICHMETRRPVARRGAEEPGRSYRQRGTSIAVGDADPGRPFRHVHRQRAAHPCRFDPPEAPARCRRDGRQGVGQDELPAGAVYLPGDVHRPGGSNRNRADEERAV